MRKILVLFITTVVCLSNMFGQSGFGTSLDCQQNANAVSGFTNLKKATFRFAAHGHGGCTGVLINRDVDDDDLGYYFVTAWHCFKTGTNCGGDEFDFDNIVRFYFNYQSPDSDNESVRIYNTRQVNRQSRFLIDSAAGYYHESNVVLIKRVACALGDFALLRIVDPIPPHFDVAHAGWNPSPYILPVNTCIHHPSGDIKKISFTTHVVNTTTPIEHNCYLVTTLIDVVFGWIWGNSVSTSVVCSYTSNPFYIVPGWSPAPPESGSSGSGLFEGSNRLIGNSSAGFLENCPIQFYNTYYSKFKNIYPRQAIKNKLNPSNKVMTDLIGLTSRKIDCHSSLQNIYGYYFPAQDYQAENKIYIRSKAEITTNDPSQNDNPGVIIFDKADYEYHATTFIELNPGFDAQPGSSFVAEINPCNSIARKAAPEIEYPSIRVLNRSNLEVIERNNKHSRFSFYPNPANSLITINFSHPPDEIAQQIVITDFSGRKVFDITTDNNVNAKTLNIKNLDNGTYFLTLVSNKSTYSDKLVIVR